jgi:hypothetical protein
MRGFSTYFFWLRGLPGKTRGGKRDPYVKPGKDNP